MDRKLGGLRRQIAVAALGAVGLLGLVPGAASASGWSPLTRLTTSASTTFAGPNGVGAFAQPDGRFLLSGYTDSFFPTAPGYTTGAAGGVFAPLAGPLVTNAVWLPDGSSLVAWPFNVQHRAANGTFLGSPQSLSITALAADSAGNATAAAVVNSNGYSLDVYTRPVAGPSFTAAASPVATSGAISPMTLVGLAVDPSGAAVVTWFVQSSGGDSINQSTRGAGAASFGTPTVLASNATGGVIPNGVSFAANATGRAVLVYYDGSGYSAAIRTPGGAFAAPVHLTGTPTSTAPNSVAAVAADGTSATLVGGTSPASNCAGMFYSLGAYRLAAAGSTWTASGVFGGGSGNSVAHPALAGGPGGRIEAAWSVDTRSTAQLCGPTDFYQLQAGTLGGPMPTIFTGAPPAFSGLTTYGNGYTGGYAARLALNSCGDGALIVGIADQSNADLHDGLFTSSTTGCGAATRPANSSPPTVSGTKTVGQKLTASTGGWSGTAPITYAYQWQRCAPGCVNIAGASASTYTLAGADRGANVRVVVTASNGAGSASANSAQAGPIGPSTGAVKSALAKALSPSGKLAKIAAILKHKGFTRSFKAPSGGTVTISWYLVPKGAHLSAAKPVLVAKGKASSAKAGTVKITVKLSASGKKLLKHSHKLKLTAKGSFKLAGGATVSTSKTFTLKR